MISTAKKLPPPLPRKLTNRRTEGRHPLQAKLEVLPLLGPLQQSRPGRSRKGLSIDLSEHGLLCCQVGYLPLGEVVRLTIHLPDGTGEPLVCHARVVRCDFRRRPSYGMRYINLSLSSADRLRGCGDGILELEPDAELGASQRCIALEDLSTPNAF
jgi:hypothetical protein